MLCSSSTLHLKEGQITLFYIIVQIFFLLSFLSTQVRAGAGAGAGAAPFSRLRFQPKRAAPASQHCPSSPPPPLPPPPPCHTSHVSLSPVSLSHCLTVSLSHCLPYSVSLLLSPLSLLQPPLTSLPLTHHKRVGRGGGGGLGGIMSLTDGRDGS